MTARTVSAFMIIKKDARYAKAGAWGRHPKLAVLSKGDYALDWRHWLRASEPKMLLRIGYAKTL